MLSTADFVVSRALPENFCCSVMRNYELRCSFVKVSILSCIASRSAIYLSFLLSSGNLTGLAMIFASGAGDIRDLDFLFLKSNWLCDKSVITMLLDFRLINFKPDSGRGDRLGVPRTFKLPFTPFG